MLSKKLLDRKSVTKNMHASSNAFSVLELLVTMSLIGILIAVSLPRSKKVGAPLRQASQDVRALLEEGKMYARELQEQVLLKHTSSSIQSSIGDKEIHTLKLRKPIELHTSLAKIVITPEGSNQPVRYELRDGTHICSVHFSLFGRVRSTC